MLANPRALSAQIAVGRIFAPGLSQTSQILAQFFPALAKKGPHNRTHRGIDSREARRARPAKNVRENRLGLIVRRMRHDDARGPAFRDHALEERISETPGGVLEIPFVGRRDGGNVFAPDDAFQSARAGEVFDKPSVRIRFRSSQSVIEVHDEQSDSQPVTQAFEDSQKRHGIRAS